MKFISIRKVKTEEEKLKHTVKTEEEKVKHTHRFKDRIFVISIETNWSRDGLRFKSDNLRRGCRLQDGGAVQRRSEKRCRGIDRRGGREARLARGGIREHDAFLGHEMRAQQGLSVVVSRWLGSGKAKAQERGMR